MLPPCFQTFRKLSNKVNAYFRYIEGQFHIEKGDNSDKKIWERDPEPATLTGLAHFIGFESRQQLEDYERSGEFGNVIRRCRLRIEALYEKKLHQQSSAGAVFALKNMGWNSNGEDRPVGEQAFASLKIEIIEGGPPLAAAEGDIVF